ncbi:cytochrome c [Pseudoroseomonas cervicalis]|uniref:c-type cytochrome n=1 Tax=Teichococcus cervicalis TaxID=204525 RepID=UPI002780FFDE|nr:cytochrome c [Pseudoroseomonas cervicalis]MDQ1077606.1 mono/diheme cytochrome c family protein [Pseudoroseomonas cervicalis]
MRGRWLLAGALLLAGLGAGAAWMLSAPRPAFAEAEAARFEGGDAARGRLVFAAGDCASCHASPGQEERLRLGGGMRLAGPVGYFRPPNISPHPEDGIGRWRGIDLANALMAGVSPGGEHYYPALPYVAFARMRPQDVADLWAYLRSLPPVAGRPPPHELPLPFRLRRAIGLWKLLYLDRSPILPDPARDAAWNRGRYLAEALMHCAECHSGRNLAGAVDQATRYAGGPDPEGTGYAPNITPTGIGHWSRAELLRALGEGVTPDGRRLGASMAEVVTNLAALPEEDRAAIADYIRALPPRPTTPP